MAPTSESLFTNMMSVHNNTTTKPHNPQFCFTFPKVVFETSDSSVPYLVNAALNVPLASVTTFTNLLVLLVLRHVTSIRFPSKLLLSSLVLTDLGVGLVVQPQLFAFLLMKAINPHSADQCSLYLSLAFTGTLFSFASLLTMTAISLDRYTALFFHLRYQQIVTTRRVCIILTLIWSCSLFYALSIVWNTALSRVVWLSGASIGFFVISVSCIKIYRRLRSQQGQQIQPQANHQAQQQNGSTLNMEKYRQIASAMMWIYVLFIICYLPLLCADLIFSAVGYTALTRCTQEFAFTVVLLNSCLNPFLYCLRLPEIRTEVMKQLRRLCCRNPQQGSSEIN